MEDKLLILGTINRGGSFFAVVEPSLYCCSVVLVVRCMISYIDPKTEVGGVEKVANYGA